MIKKKKETTIEDLAGMVQKGFDHVDLRFDKVEKRMDNMEDRMDSLERGQEDIKLRLDNVAHRFEFKELENRVKVLERKMARA